MVVLHALGLRKDNWRIVVSSKWPTLRAPPGGLVWRSLTRKGMKARSLPSAMSHSLSWPGKSFSGSSYVPPLAEAKVFPSGENPTHVIEFVCPDREARSLPVATSQRMMELGVTSIGPPPDPIARVFPSGENARDQGKRPSFNLSSSFSTPVAMSQSFTVPFAEARVLPSGEKAKDNPLVGWPFSVTRSRPVDTSQSFTSPGTSSGSQLPVMDAKAFPSGENTTRRMGALCPFSV